VTYVCALSLCCCLVADMAVQALSLAKVSKLGSRVLDTILAPVFQVGRLCISVAALLLTRT
jgi:hypothetical protein